MQTEAKQQANPNPCKTKQSKATTKTNPLLAVGPGNEGGSQHVDRRQLACQTKQYSFHVSGEGGRRVHVSILVLWRNKTKQNKTKQTIKKEKEKRSTLARLRVNGGQKTSQLGCFSQNHSPR